MRLEYYDKIGEGYKIPDVVAQYEKISFNGYVDLKYIGSIRRDNDESTLVHFFLDRLNRIYFCPNLRLKLPESLLEYKMCYRVHYFKLEHIIDKIISRDVVHLLFKEMYHVKDFEIKTFVRIGQGT